MVLIDTSSWVETLRESGRSEVRQRVVQLTISGEAVWCDPVRLELWHGARGHQEKKRLDDMDRTLISLPVDQDVWDLSIDLARRARGKGITVPPIDLIIAACARYHEAGIEAADQHFGELMRL